MEKCGQGLCMALPTPQLRGTATAVAEKAAQQAWYTKGVLFRPNGFCNELFLEPWSTPPDTMPPPKVCEIQINICVWVSNIWAGCCVSNDSNILYVTQSPSPHPAGLARALQLSLLAHVAMEAPKKVSATEVQLALAEMRRSGHNVCCWTYRM